MMTTTRKISVIRQHLFVVASVPIQIHGSILVPATFVIPSSNDNDDDDNVARCNTESTTGKHVQRIQLRRDFLSGDDGDDRRAILDESGFVWDVG